MEEQSNLPEVVQNDESSLVFYNTHFYSRKRDDESPLVANRRIKPNRVCRLCKLVPTLMDEHGYTWEEATDVEKDMYKFIYTFWPAEDIARWLKDTHEYQTSHDAVSRHIKKHIVDPGTAALERVRSYRPEFMNKKFFLQLTDTMKLSMSNYAAGVATGAIPMSHADFIAMAKLLRDWQGFIQEMQEDKTDLFMEAVGNAIEKTLAPYPEIKKEFVAIFQEELEKIEKEEE
jgi:hypothetical protein